MGWAAFKNQTSNIKRRTSDVKRQCLFTFEFSSAEVLRYLGQLFDVDVLAELSVGPHLGRVDVQDLDSAVFLRKSDLDLDLQTTWER